MEDNYKSYAEACSTMRHYSNISFAIRLVSFVHGLTLLSIWALNYQKGDLVILFSIPILGVALTWLIYMFHKGYYDASVFFNDEAARMEEGLFKEGYFPFQRFKRYHMQRYGRWTAKYFTLHAPFTFIGILFFVVLVLTICKWTCGDATASNNEPISVSKCISK